MPQLLLTAFLLAFPPPTSPGPSLTLWNAGLVDLETRSVRSGMRVEVAAGRIARVEPAAERRPRGGTVVDATGKYLIPGLWDSHVHLTKLGACSLPVFVANGVTSVRDMGSDLGEVLQWRGAIESGARPGPRIKTAGRILESRANVERMKREQTVEPVDRIRIPVGTPEEAEAAVARLAAEGADFLKVRTTASAAVLSAIAGAAAARGLKLTGHAVAGPDKLIEAKMASVEHLLTFPTAGGASSERRPLFDRIRDAGMRMGTTTVNLESFVLLTYDEAAARLRDDPLRRYVGSYLAADWAEQIEEKKGLEAAKTVAMFRGSVAALYRDLREMHDAGVKLLAGSDAAVALVHPGFSLHGELESLVRNVGLAPADALRAATVHPAEFFGLEQELGAVRPGYRADLVLLDGNPLDDIRHTRRIAGVVRDGRWLDRKALDALLQGAAREARERPRP